jgi:TRAP-type C4-dicarboxylate transport system substrate-binding protein
LLVIFLSWPWTYANAETAQLRVSGFFSIVHKVIEVEKRFFAELPERTGLEIAVSYAPLDQLGVKMPDALRLVKSRTFDIMVAGLGNVARDDPFIEGADIAGVSTNAEVLRNVLDAYRPAMETRLRERFNIQLMALWPAGIQGLFCNTEIKTIDDLKGKKIRVWNASQALVLEALGATSLTMQMPEVYLALQRGVMDCATTSPSAGNTAKWTEVTTHYVPLSIGAAVNAYHMNLDTWNEFPPTAQRKLAAEFKRLEGELWEVGTTVQDDGLNCSVNREPCKDHKRYNLTLVPKTADFDRKLQIAAEGSAVKAWGAACDKVYPGCSKVWNGSVGKVSSLMVK